MHTHTYREPLRVVGREPCVRRSCTSERGWSRDWLVGSRAGSMAVNQSPQAPGPKLLVEAETQLETELVRGQARPSLSPVALLTWNGCRLGAQVGAPS